MEILKSRKFILALLIVAISAIALFTGFLDGSLWVAAVTVVCGIYGAANVIQTKIESGYPDDTNTEA